MQAELDKMEPATNLKELANCLTNIWESFTSSILENLIGARINSCIEFCGEYIRT